MSTKTQDAIRCEVCGQQFQHLQSHVSQQDDHPDWEAYQQKHPDARAITQEIHQQMSENAKMYDTWNKGLTKETSEKVRQNAEAISDALEGRSMPWMEGNSHAVGNEPPNKKAKITKTCKYCGDEFKVRPSRAKGLHERKFCQYKCYWDWKSESGQSLKSLLEIKDPNTLEERLIRVIQEHDLPFEYVGDGSLIIGGRCPDFTHETDDKCIEVFGDYWHDPEMNETVEWERTEEGRKAFFKSHGYETLVLWQSDLEEVGDADIAGKIQRFSANKSTIEVVQ